VICGLASGVADDAHQVLELEDVDAWRVDQRREAACARSAFFTASPIDCMIGSPQNHDI
jgi:hypothetical protein